MNSEELELSLRTEFESYLKGIFAGMQQDVADFQTNFEAEFVKHKAQTDEAFRSLSARFESDLTFDKAFTESVVEHLRLARDDGAQLTANAFGEAEKLERSTPAANYDLLRDAIDDICSQSTQASILRSLVDQVSHSIAAAAAEDDPKLREIEALLDERIRPYLAGDGGWLEVVELAPPVLKIRYEGACGSCPSSLSGTLMPIENMIKEEIDPEIEVVAG